MRVRLRILGLDVVDFATGQDTADPDAVDERGPGSTSADLSVGPKPFGFAPHDEPIVIWDE